MSADLIIWLPDDLSGAWGWQHGEEGGEARDAGEKSALGRLDTSKVTVIVSGKSVRVFEHSLPAMRERERLSAAGFAIESKIATPLSEQHVVLGTRTDTRLAVISHQKMKDIMVALSEADISPEGIFADFDVLSAHSELIALEDRVIYAGILGYTTDRAWSDERDNRHLPSILKDIDPSTALNLRQGQYVAQRRGSFDLSMMLRMAVLILFAGVAWLAYLSMDGRAMNAQAEVLNSETRALYMQVTGNSAPANPALAVTRAVKSGGKTQTDFLALSDILFRAVQLSEGISVDSLQFDGRTDQLTLKLIYPRFESAGELEQVVEQMGGVFQSGGVREQNGRLVGDAVLTRGTR